VFRYLPHLLFWRYTFSIRKPYSFRTGSEIILSEDFVKVASTNDIHPSQMKEIQLDGEIICLVMPLATFVHIKADRWPMALLRATKLNVLGIVPNSM
jgi:hypothetical protein